MTHEHTPGAHQQRQPSDVELRVRALEALLVEKGLVSTDAIDAVIEHYEHEVGPHNGARVVARAWSDPAYKARLLADGTAAVQELGIEMAATKLIVVENRAGLHNLVVCTLCSCYPRMLLGLPPDWYKSRAYRSRAVREPRAVLSEFGTLLPDSVEVRVHDSTADMRYLVLPERPSGTEGWSEERLAQLVSRDSMIGVTRPVAPG